MNKKIGILTFHQAANTGALLQAYALHNTISKYQTSEIIDYRSIAFKSDRKKGLIRFAKDTIKFILHPKVESGRIKTNRNYKKFRNSFLNLSPTYFDSNIDQINSKYDSIVCGSDQVWNTNITKNDFHYYLDIVEPQKRKSYAASFGSDDLKNPRISQELSKFNLINVREKERIPQLEKMGFKNCVCCCDPVFLLSKEEWLKITPLRKKSKKYILVYFILDPINSVSFINSISSKYNLDVIFYNAFNSKTLPGKYKNINFTGPLQFLSLLNNAELVITTSFHGLALSLIYNKPFYFEMNPKYEMMNGRIRNLIEHLNIGNREITSKNFEDLNYSNIDWDSINKRMNDYKNSSLEMLKKDIE